MTGSEGTQLQRPSPSLRAEQNAAFQFTAQSLQPCLSGVHTQHHLLYYILLLLFNFFILFFFKSMKADFKASSKQNHLIHYRSEYRPLQNPLWDNYYIRIYKVGYKITTVWYRKRYTRIRDLIIRIHSTKIITHQLL